MHRAEVWWLMRLRDKRRGRKAGVECKTNVGYPRERIFCDFVLLGVGRQPFKTAGGQCLRVEKRFDVELFANKCSSFFNEDYIAALLRIAEDASAHGRRLDLIIVIAKKRKKHIRPDDVR